MKDLIEQICLRPNEIIVLTEEEKNIKNSFLAPLADKDWLTQKLGPLN